MSDPIATNEDQGFITFDDFSKVDLKVGTILTAEPHTKGTKLYVLTVELGEAKPRTILAGIRQHYTVDQLIGRQIIVVANLAPREVLGVVSEGMLLAAKDKNTGVVRLIGINVADSDPRLDIAPGSEVG